MGKKQFKAESKRLLDLMINSIYTNKEIFLREIISNASDAIDKLCYISLTDDKVGLERSDYRIRITVDKDARTITVSDNGIGMSQDEAEKNLGVIAKSGSYNFKNDMSAEEAEKDDISIIGQFGVGFYSAFMVSDKVTVITKKYGEEKGVKWESTGADGSYLEIWKLKALVKKYSDYVRWPIVMDITHQEQQPTGEEDKDGKPIMHTVNVTAPETVNSMVPIWQRAKTEVTDDECVEWYKETNRDQTDPAAVLRINAEGVVSYKALLFIPGSTPYDYYTKEYEKGLALYASGVMIMEKCGDLLPDYFSFVKGVVDSEDLSLNISRETLQKDNQLKLMRSSLEKKIKNELHAMLVNDREKYETFWKNFGRQVKFGVYGDYGMHKDLLGDLLMFYSAKEQKLVTLDEYIEKMPEGQKCIYFAAGDDTDRLGKLPNAQLVLSKGYDLLLCTEDVDEFCLQVMHDYKEKEFQNINTGDLGLETEDEKKAAEAAETENKDLFEEIKKDLNGKIKEVKVNPTLQEHPVTLSSAEGGISMEMEKVLRRMPNAEGVESTKVLELNPNHTVFAALKAAHAAGDTDKVAKYVELLYDQALLIAGLPIEDPVAYAQLVCGLMQ